MDVFRISSCRYITDLTGTGAAMYGGRWNSVGVHIVYTAGSASLAMLESLVHMGGRIVGDFCQVAIELPEDSILEITEKDLPKNWRESPAPTDLQSIGDKFIEDQKFLLLKVPSVLVPNESNFLINPVHPDFKKVKIWVKSNIKFDERLLKKGD